MTEVGTIAIFVAKRRESRCSSLRKKGHSGQRLGGKGRVQLPAVSSLHGLLLLCPGWPLCCNPCCPTRVFICAYKPKLTHTRVPQLNPTTLLKGQPWCYLPWKMVASCPKHSLGICPVCPQHLPALTLAPIRLRCSCSL